MNKSTRQTQKRKNRITSAAATTIGRKRENGNGSKLKHGEQTENALRESEEKYRTLFENAKDAIILADTETGILLDVNTAGCRMLGLPKEKIIGKHQSEIHPPTLADKYKQVFQDHIQKGVVIDEDMIIQRADGVQIPVGLSANVVKLADKTVIQGTFHDMTERIRMAKAIRDSEEKFAKVFRLSPLEVCITRIKDGKTMDVNDSFIRNSGFTREEVIGHTSTELDIWVKPEDRQKMLELLKKDGRIHNEEFEFRNKKGGDRISLFSAEPINFNGEECIISIVVDITDRKQIEKILRESEEKFSKAFHATPQEIIITRDRDNITLEVNDSFTHVTGFTREETVGRTAEELGVWMKPEDKERQQRLLKEKGRVINEEFEFFNKAGETHTELISVEPITIGGEKCWISILTDITERKKMEQALANEAIWRRILIEQSRDGIVVLDQNGKVFEANQHFAEMLGYSTDEVLQLNVWDWEYQLPRDQVAEMIRSVDEKGDHFETKHRRKDGTIVDVEISTNGATFAKEKLVFCVCRDITERKKMEQALRESEERISKAFQAIPEAISIGSLEDDVFLEVNDSFISFSGYSREDIIGHTTKEIVHWVNPDDYQRMHQLKDKHTHFKNEEFLLQRKSGETITLLMSGDVINFGGKPCFLVVGNDITERKKMEQALANEAIRRRILIEQSRDGVVVLDKNGKVYESNQAFNKMLGYSPEEISQLHVWEWGVQGTREQVLGMLMNVDETGDHFEAKHRRKDGTIVDVEISTNGATFAKEKLVFCVCRDITERKKMEEMQKAENHILTLLEQGAELNELLDAIVRLCEKNDPSTKGSILLYDASKDCLTGFGPSLSDEYNAMLKTGIPIGPNMGSCGTAAHLKQRVVVPEIKNSPLFKTLKEAIELATKNGLLACWSEPIISSSGGILGTIANYSDHAGEPTADNIRVLEWSAQIAGIAIERKRMEHTLRESEEKFSKAFHAMPEAVTISRLKDGVFIDVNETFCHDNGCTREEAIGHSGEELYLSLGPGYRDQVVKHVKERGRVTNMEFETKNKSGEMQAILFSADTVNIGGEPCLLSIRSDITERKKMEHALRESEEKFSKAFHAIPESVSISRLKDGLFIDVNESFLKLNKITREQVIGHTAKELDLLRQHDKRNRIRDFLQKTGHFENEEMEITTKSGKKLTYLFSADTINIGGEPCLLVIGNDISKRKQAEKNLKKAMTDLEASSAQLHATNKELESFSYSVSHDLRSPLRSIDGFSQALLEDYTTKLDETGQDYLNRLRTASQKMGELIDGLLKLSRLTRSEMHHEKVDLTLLANEIAARLQETQDKRDVKVIIGQNLTTNGDPQMLRVLLENLLGNAFKFTKNTMNAQIEFGSKIDGERKTFFIKDNGAGFDMAFKDKLFGAFQRLHDSAEFPGTGIGLATVQRIINRHGGSISAEGAVGKGATFYFTLN